MGLPPHLLNVVYAMMANPSAEARKRWMEFECKPDDVLICTFPKSGTTLMQQIIQSLRTAGDMSFEEISLVIPFIEMSYDYGVEDINVAQPGCVRAFKSHAPRMFSPLVEGTKCINIIRNPLHVATSFYHYQEGWVFDEGTVQVDEFVNLVMAPPAEGAEPKKDALVCAVWHHITSWYPHRSDKNVLYLFYDDIVQHKEECVRLVAEFLGIELSRELLATTVAQSSHEAMALAHSKYDDHPLKKRRNHVMDRLPDAGIDVGKVRAPGKAKAVLSEETTATLLATWERIVTPVTGCKTYEELREQVNSELGRSFAKPAAAKQNASAESGKVALEPDAPKFSEENKCMQD